MRKTIITIGLLLMFLVVLLILTRRDQNSPYTDTIFIKDRPGANGRHITYTPVLKDDPSVKVGPVIGADFGHIHFKDIDGDGVKETIIETQLPIFGTGEFYADTMTILRYTHDSEGKPLLVEISTEQRGIQEWAK